MAPRVEIAQATEADARELAPRLRPEEVAEVRASAGAGPLEVLLDAVSRSERAFAARFDGELACLWGVVHVRHSAVSGRVGAAWLLTSDLVERYPKTFWRHCIPEVRRLFDGYGVLTNAIDARHEKAVRWARRLGFQLEAAETFGAEQRPFHLFRARQEDLRCANR